MNFVEDFALRGREPRATRPSAASRKVAQDVTAVISKSSAKRATSRAGKSAKAAPGVLRLRLPREKGNELFGLALLTVSVLLGLALASFHVDDPSVFHQPPFADAAVRNWVGPIGAQISAVLFNFFGVTCLLLPPLLLLAGWRRVRTQLHEHALGRGIGVLVLLAALPEVLRYVAGPLQHMTGGRLDAAILRQFSRTVSTAL